MSQPPFKRILLKLSGEVLMGQGSDHLAIDPAMTARVAGEIAAEFAARPEVAAVAVSHRIGLLGIGDVALACAVSAAHRGQAFAACAELVDEVKARLPIWKRQVFTDGDEEWVACP